ncbi:MAG: P27 family phage terminase small subunit [bacterium]
MAKVASKEAIKRATVRDMKRLGVHKPEYNRLVDIYAGLVHQYLVALADFEMDGYQYETATAAGGTKKSAIVGTLENLRKDILQYSDRLCLNPKSLETVTTESAGKSKLASALNELGAK